MITNKTLIRKTEELSKRYIQIGIYFQNIADTFKHNEFKENKKFKGFVIKRLKLVEEFQDKINLMKIKD